MNNFDHYRVFYHVVSYGNMRQAAQILGLTPSTVSRVIQALEEELGCQLFVRSKRGVRLTNAGEILFARVKPAYGLMQAGENELRALIHMDSGSLSIGVSDMTAQQFIIPVCLKRFCRQYPHITVRLKHLSNRETEDAILSGAIDLAVASFLPQETVSDTMEIRRLYHVNDIAVVGKAYASLSEKKLTLEDLAELPLVFVPETMSVHAYYSGVFRRRKLRFTPHIETPAIEEQLLAAETGLGYTLVPEISARQLLQEGRLFSLQLSPDAFLKRPICLFTPKEFPLTHAAQAFQEVMLAAAEELLQSREEPSGGFSP